MDGLEKLDHTHAIFSGFASIWQRMFLFCACGVFGQFVGGNIYNAPKFMGKVLLSGPAALADLRPMDLAWLPLEWAGALLISSFHLATIFYLPMVLFAFLSLMRDDEIKLWALAVLLVGQPIDAWFIWQSWEGPLRGGDLGISLALLVLYTVLAIGGCYAWWRLREDLEE